MINEKICDLTIKENFSWQWKHLVAPIISQKQRPYVGYA